MLDEELRSNYVKGLSWMEPLLRPLFGSPFPPARHVPNAVSGSGV